MVSPMVEPGNSILNGIIRKEQEMYFSPHVLSRRDEALRELYGGHPPEWKKGPNCFPVIVIPRIVPDGVMALLPNIHKSAPREYKDGKVMEREGGSVMGSMQGSAK